MGEDLTKRRKRLSYRCWHRGTKELDLLVGGFADRYLASFDGEQLDDLEALLQVPEPLLYAWLTGAATPPEEHDNRVTRLLVNFRLSPPIS